VTVALKDKANYEWTDSSTTDLTFNFVIAKATYDMSGVVFANKTVTYNVESHSILATNLPNGVTVAYTGNGQTEAGEYTITATFTGDVNYNAIPTQTAKLVIEKAQVTKPVADTTVFVYNSQAQTYTIATSNLYTVSGNVETLAGSYTVTVALKDKANYEWTDGSTTDLTFNFVIAKATYDMSGVTFVSKTVKYDASEHEVVLTGTLPTGVTVTYTNNKGTNAGIYNAVATFAYDTANYNTIADMTATLTINRDVQSYVNPETNKQDVIVSSNEGIDPTKDLVVELVEKEVSDEAYDEFLQDNQKVAVAYDIKLLQNNISVQPDGTITIKILIPQELKNRDFEIFHIHDGKKVAVEYRIEGDYAVFETNKLSEFMFVYNMGSILWLVIVLAVIVLMEIGFLLFLSKKQKQSNTTKVLGAYPPFVLGMFIAEWQVILFIALAVAVAVLAVVIIISATKALNKQSDAPVQTVEEDGKKSTRIVKSFSERLEQSSDEVKGFYKAIKDELLSYTTVKSKISFKHETFRVGKAAVARIKMRGKSLCLFLALDSNDYKDTKYKIKDMSSIT
ncbi:MAG: hypothetical protein J6Q55_03430, partial [Clostridia bacterium]|nr:hypothetical protein [Clostridia bacterium]